jgi:hypothetical protein
VPRSFRVSTSPVCAHARLWFDLANRGSPASVVRAGDSVRLRHFT